MGPQMCFFPFAFKDLLPRERIFLVCCVYLLGFMDLWPPFAFLGFFFGSETDRGLNFSHLKLEQCK